MKKYYWSIESGRVISLEELNSIRSEFYPNDTLEKFISDCSYLNNGDIEPIELQIAREEKELTRAEEEIKQAREHLEELRNLAKQTV